MAKKSKPEAEKRSENASSDIFKVLFGGGASEEPGLGLGLRYSVPNPKHGEQENREKRDRKERITEHLKPRIRNHENEEKSDLDANVASEAEESLEKSKKRKKKEKEKRRDYEASDVNSIGEDEVKNKKKKKKEKKEKGVETGLGVVVSADRSLERVEKGNGILNENEKQEEKKKKKRKRSEIEEEYELRNQIVVGDKEEVGVSKRVVGEKRKTVDDPKEMMVSKEGFDDESKLLRTIFVGNLPLKIKKKVLLKEFSTFGAIESARIRSVPLVDTKAPRKAAIFKGEVNESIDSVHAYIVFKEEKAAQASLAHNMAMVGGNHVRVDMACPPRKKLKGEPLYDNKRTVFVGNLPFDVKDEELYQLFCGISQLQSSIEAVRVIRDPHTSVGKGIAYVLFKTRVAANMAIRNKHLKLRDRELRLCHARADSSPSSKKRPMHASEDNSPSKRLAIASTQSATKKEARGTLSYQGLQANKSGGVQKKENFQKTRTREEGNKKYRSGYIPEGRRRKNKRPAVAARKANALKGIAGPGKQSGKKRKLDSSTPESSHRNKKARKLR